LYYSVDYGLALPNLGPRGRAGSIPADSGGDSESIYKERIANTVSNGIVTAGVLAANRAQEYGYTFLTVL
jgi:hypothetical protein